MIRLTPGLVATYVLVLVATITLTVGRVPPQPAAEEEAVPALAAVGSRTGQSAGRGLIPSLLPPERLKALLRAGFPVLGAREAVPASRTVIEPQSVVNAVIRALAGFDVREPKSLLRAELPILTFVDEPITLPPYAAPPVPEGELPPTGPPPPAVRPVVVGDKPLVGIYHTHARESYLPALPAATGLRPGDAFSNDPAINMVRVGQALAAALAERGIGTVHSAQMHDLDGRLGAYVNSLATAQTILREYPSIKVLLDLHRDSQLRSETAVEIGGRTYARVMVVVGFGSGQMPQPHWHENMALARKLVAALEQKYPGISRGIFPKNQRYNQHVSPGALLLEIGGVENSLDEATRTAYALADVLAGMVAAGQVPR